VLLASLFGFLGLLLATPLAAAVLVLVKMLYIENVFHEQIDVDGAD
jgi:predicted PurR-regulated permease PerM